MHKIRVKKDEILKLILGNNIVNYADAIEDNNLVSINNFRSIPIGFFYDRSNNNFYKKLCITNGIDINTEFLKQYKYEIGALKKQLASSQPSFILNSIVHKFNDYSEIKTIIHKIKKNVADIVFNPPHVAPYLFSVNPFMERLAALKTEIKQLKRCLAIVGECRRKLIFTVFKVINSNYVNDIKMIEIINVIAKEFQPKRRKKDE